MTSERSKYRRIAGGLIFLLGLGSPCFFHVVSGHEKSAVSVLVLCQGAGLALLSGRWLLCSVMTTVLFFLAYDFPTLVRNADAVVVYGLGLMIPLRLFVSSLLPGREPLVTALARQAHGGGPLRQDVLSYTDRQTWFWVVFLGLLLVLPLLLALFGPVHAWLWLVRGGVFALVLTVLAVEYGVRRLVIRNFDHVSPWAAVRLWRARFPDRS